MKDWLKHLGDHAQTIGKELDLDSLQPGDLLQVLTLHTIYSLKINSGRDAELVTNRPDRPSGPVLINGCTFGQSSTIKPDHLFCGGNLEFQFDNKKQIQTTTVIREIRLVRKI